MCFPQKRSCVCIFETCEERNVGGGLFDFCFETEAQAVFGQEAKGKSMGSYLPPQTPLHLRTCCLLSALGYTMLSA